MPTVLQKTNGTGTVTGTGTGTGTVGTSTVGTGTAPVLVQNSGPVRYPIFRTVEKSEKM